MTPEDRLADVSKLVGGNRRAPAICDADCEDGSGGQWRDPLREATSEPWCAAQYPAEAAPVEPPCACE
jgi:hypothetical protein